MKKLPVLFLIGSALALWAPLTSSLIAQSQNIVISEFRLRGPNGAGDEFIELHNISASPINVGGWRVRASASFRNSEGDRVLIPSGTLINPGCYYLVALTGSNGFSGGVIPNLTYTTDVQDNGGIAITTNNGVPVDQVGMSIGSPYKEGTPLAPLTSNSNLGYERKPGASAGYVDTNDNAANFQVIAPSTPQNSASRCLGTTDPSVVAGATPNPVVQQESLLIAAAVTRGAMPTSTGLQVMANLAPLGWSSTQVLYDDGTNGDAVAGDNIFSYLLAAVSADPGTHAVAVLVTDAQSRSGSDTVDVVVEAMPIIYLPHDLQGAGQTSPLLGELVAVDGVVTARRSDGLFIQTAPGLEDSDPASSEALFVFSSSAPPDAAAVGTLVRVNGVVAEFSADNAGLTRTQLVQPSFTTLGDNALPVPTPVTLADLTPDGGRHQLERFEGMRVSIDSLSTVSGSDNDGVFYGVLTGTPRPVREPGLEPQIADTFTTECALGTVCNIPLFDGNPERLRVDTNALGAPRLDVTSGVVLSGITGIVDSGHGTWALLALPDQAGAVSANAIPFAVTTPTPYHFTVGSVNLEPTFDLSKTSLAIRSYLRMPDVVAVQGAESLSVLQQLATRVNTDAGLPNEYTAHAGFLVRGRVQVSSLTQEPPNETFADPPAVLRATVDGPFNVLNASIIVVAVHVDEMTGVDSPSSPDVRLRRHQQAESIATLLDDLQEQGAVVVVGDFNAFDVSDGLVDVLGTMRGGPAASDQVVVASPDLVQPDYALATAGGYSFVSDGHAQALDHVLLSTVAMERFAGALFARVNADFPAVFGADSARVERFAAHDPPVAYFTFPPDVVPPVIASFTAGTQALWPVNHRMVPVSFALEASDNLAIAHCAITRVTSNEPVGASVDWTIDGPLSVSLRAERVPQGNGRIYTVTVTCQDVAGNVSSAATAVTVPTNQGGSMNRGSTKPGSRQ